MPSPSQMNTIVANYVFQHLMKWAKDDLANELAIAKVGSMDAKLFNDTYMAAIRETR